MNLERSPTKHELDELYFLEPGSTAKGTRHLLKRLEQSCFIKKKEGAYRRVGTEERLIEQYCGDGLTLFLGAGVSLGSGLPSWRKLIDSILQSEGFRIRRSKRLGCVSSSRVLAEYAGLPLTAQFDLIEPQNDIEFARKLSEGLYGSPDFQKLRNLLGKIPISNDEKKAPKTWQLWTDIKKEIADHNQTLEAVGDLLLGPQAEPPAPNPQIHAVLTVNVDNLLQSYVMACANGEWILTTVDRPSVGDHPGRIPVYHLHGFLDARVDSSSQEADEDSDESVAPELVFRESEYFNVIASPTGFANYTAHSFLQRHNVLFIGTSLDDINLRRWLYDSYSERVRARTRYLRQIYPDHYEDAEQEARYASVRHFWFRTKNDLPVIERNGSIITEPTLNRLMRNFGIEIVWCETHADVARCLRKLRAVPPRRSAR